MIEARFGLARVEDMPDEISSGILYVSDEYEIACHRCACGCGSLVYTPLGSTEWRFCADNGKPSLKPSIGNWALPCRSHYWISKGRVVWAGDWSDDQVRSGRDAEAECRDDYYQKKAIQERQHGILAMLKRAFAWIFRR
jgi:Family of unknown function (DUF6527)